MSGNINNAENMTAQEFYDTIIELQEKTDKMRAQAKKEKGKGKQDISKEIGRIMSQIREWRELFERYHYNEYDQLLRDDGKGLKTRKEVIDFLIEAERNKIKNLERWIEYKETEILEAKKSISEMKGNMKKHQDRIKELESGGDIWK